MITAIPMSRDKIASHFSKAERFVFIDAQGHELAAQANPGLQEGCAGKAKILTLLQQQQVQRVIVRNIGERLLSRLLDADLNVFQIGSSHWDSPQFLADAPRYLLPLISAEQGRPSINYQQKQANGGCGCQNESSDASHACCHHSAEHGDKQCAHVSAEDSAEKSTEHHAIQRCCQRRSANAKAQSQRHCCH